MRKPRARRRLALTAAALGALAAGAALVGLPAAAAPAAVSYTCRAGGAQTDVSHQVVLDLAGATNAVIGAEYVATLTVVGSNPIFQAPEGGIPQGAWVQFQPTITVSSSPSPLTPRVIVPTASASVTDPVQAQTAVTPMPALTITMTPSPGASSMVLSAGNFSLRMVVNGQSTALYDCVLAQGASPAALTVTLTGGDGGASPSASGDISPSPSASPSRSPSPSPRVTRTEYVTVFTSPRAPDRTPSGGADTGGGGMAGPDGRVLVLTGSLLIAAAAGGGLYLRRRGLRHG